MKALTAEILEQMFIKAEERMYQEGWSQDEISLFKDDPVISLFYGSCAEELGLIQQEISHVEQNLIRKTIGYFLPEEFHAPSPAHAILQTYPMDKIPECLIGPEYQLSVVHPEPPKTQFTFTPAGKYPIYPAEVEYLVFRNNVYRFEDGKKVLKVSASAKQTTQDDNFWIGIRGLNPVLPLKELPLFFSLLQNPTETYSFLKALKFCKCSDGKTPIKMDAGLPSSDTDIREKMLDHPDHIVYKLFQNARDHYQNHFITLHNLPAPDPEMPSFPSEISKFFSAGDLEKINCHVYWIRFNSGNLFKESWMTQLYCGLNCFPAVNLKIEQEQFDVEIMPLNIFPISCSDPILTIQAITGKTQKKPEETNYLLLDPDYRGTAGLEGQAIFKKGGLRRMDPLKLKNMLNDLGTILKEETILLTKDGTKDDLDKLNRLNRAINDFEQSVELEKTVQDKFSGSVILRPFREHNRIFIRYWSTKGEEANQVKPLTGEDGAKQCDLIYAPDLKAEMTRLITTTTGGKRKPTEEEHLDTLRKLLLTRGRIVTAEDIKVFCYEHFSGYKISVDVKKGYMQSQNAGQGITRVIEIKISFLEKGGLKAEELLVLQEELLKKLEQNSNNFLPFKVEIV